MRIGVEAGNSVLHPARNILLKGLMNPAEKTNDIMSKLRELTLSGTALDDIIADRDDISDGTLDYLVGLAGGALKRVPVYIVSPFQFRETGDGWESGDYTACMNAMCDFLRTKVIKSSIRYIADCTGVEADITGNGVNVTGFQAWNFEFRYGVFTGKTTGKAVFDFSGSRGYLMNQVRVIGDLAMMPSVPFLIARTTSSFGNCDNCGFFKVAVDGHFSVAAFYEYGQESTSHFKCQYWNDNYDASIAIFQRSDTYVVPSMFQTVVTGAVSHINCTYINCDFRYGGSTHRNTITGITQASEAVITVSGTNIFQVGDLATVFLSLGMTEINAYRATVTARTSTTVTLGGIDSSGFSAFTGSAFLYRPMTGPGIYMSGMQDHKFINCYLVAIGQDGILLDCNSGTWSSNQFEFLQEGAVTRSIFRIQSGAGIEEFVDCKFLSYNTHARGSYFSTDGAAPVTFRSGEIRVRSHMTMATLPLVDSTNAAQYRFLGDGELYYPQYAGVTKGSYGGWLFNDNYGDDTDLGDRDYTPTISATGSITTLGAVTGRICFIKRKVALVYGSVTITTNGAASGTLNVSLPSGLTTTAKLQHAFGSLASNGMVYGRIAASQNSFAFRKATDGSYPGADGMVMTWEAIIELI